MSPQHLSDEAVAAFADGVLNGHAHERAARHINSCDECAAYTRPAGVDGGFDPPPEPPEYTRPPETISPQERAVFGRPPGAEAFAPAPGERIPPRPAEHAPVPGIFAQAFGPTPDAQD